MSNKDLMQDYQSRIAELEKENRRLSWKLKLEAAGNTRQMQEIVSATADAANASLFFLDKNYNISFFSGNSCLKSDMAEELMTKDGLRSELYIKNITEIIRKSIKKQEMSNGDYCWMYSVKLKGLEVFYLLLFTADCSLEEDIPYLFELAEDEFGKINMYRQQGNIPVGDFNYLMKEIIDGKITDISTIDAYMKRLQIPPKRYISIAVAEINSVGHRKSSETVMSKLKALFPESEATIIDNNIVIMISSNDRSIQPKPKFDEKILNELLSDQGAYIAFSNATQRLDRIRTNYLLAERTLKLGQVMRSNTSQRIFFFEDFAEYITIEFALYHYKTIMGHDDPLFLTNPEAVNIYRYDKNNGTKYLDVLFHYCRCKGNISEASKAAFMHRNTFSVKIAEIKKMLDINLDDGDVQQRMIFSCKVFRYFDLYYDKLSSESLAERLAFTQKISQLESEQ